MGFRTRSATPGTILCLAATALLGVVSFNTPLIKSLYFLKATYSSGDLAGTMTLGTLGYCLDTGSSTDCTGPQVGYEFGTFCSCIVFPFCPSIARFCLVFARSSFLSTPANAQTLMSSLEYPPSTSQRQSRNTSHTHLSYTSLLSPAQSSPPYSVRSRTSPLCPCCASRHALHPSPRASR